MNTPTIIIRNHLNHNQQLIDEILSLEEYKIETIAQIIKLYFYNNMNRWYYYNYELELLKYSLEKVDWYLIASEYVQSQTNRPLT